MGRKDEEGGRKNVFQSICAIKRKRERVIARS